MSMWFQFYKCKSRGKKPWRTNHHPSLICLLSLQRQQIISSWFRRAGNSFLQHYWTREWHLTLRHWTDEPDIIIYLINSANKTTSTPFYGTPDSRFDVTLIPHTADCRYQTPMPENTRHIKVKFHRWILVYWYQKSGNT